MKNQKIYAAVSAAILAFSLNFLVFDQWFPQYSSISFSNLFSNSNSTNSQKSKVQVALLLDTSSSMDGLIEQAKSQLWQILNSLAKMEQEGNETSLEIALYEYGNPSRSTKKNQIRKLSDFTTDMDLISEILFSLTTNGGNEYCGEVIQTSVKNLEWGQNDSDLKMIYIAGNEPFTQGPINYAEACQFAKKQNIYVNTIFCGREEEGIQSMWKQGANLGNGSFMNIDHNQVTTYIETPYDDKINELNNELNDTYIPFESKGKIKKETQITQDKNAYQFSKSNAAERAEFKSSKKYKTDWDLVDTYKKDKNIITRTWTTKEMTDSLQSLTIEELEEKIEKVSTQRSAIQDKIKQNNALRKKYIEENSKSKPEEKSLKFSIEKSIEKQAKQKGYKMNN